MDRKAAKTLAALALTALLAAPSDGAEGTAKRPAGGDPRRKGRTGESYRLEEMRITAAGGLPAVLFFLPRSPVRLLPLRPDWDGPRDVRQDDTSMGDVPR